MNYVARPAVDDHLALFVLARNHTLKDYPICLMESSVLIAAYMNYLDSRGDATLITSANISDALAEFLEYYYKHPPKELPYIRALRRGNRQNVCPMCGSFGSGQLDHLLPRSTHPEYLVLSANLVPACNCNGLRSTTTVGQAPGERVLHPYFDSIMSKRLLVARFVAPFRDAPGISLHIKVSQIHPLYAAINFHVNSVVLKTEIIGHLIKRWATLWRDPSTVLPTLNKRGHKTIRDVRKSIFAELRRQDRLNESKNNWDSIFIYGLYDLDVMNWIVNHVNGTPPVLL